MRFTTFGFLAYAQKISEICPPVLLSQSGDNTWEGVEVSRYNCGERNTGHVVADEAMRASSLCIHVMSTNRFSIGDGNIVSALEDGLRQIFPSPALRYSFAAVGGF